MTADARVRFGVVGFGPWGRVHVQNLLTLADRCEVTHVATRRPPEGLPPGVSVVADWRELLTAPCDAVVIATSTPTHAEILEAFVRARKPCIVEKPLCLDVTTAERLHALIARLKVPVLVNYTLIFSDAYQTLKRAVSEGTDPIRLIWSEGMNRGPFRADTPALWDWCSHDVSLCLDLMGTAPTGTDGLGVESKVVKDGPAGDDATESGTFQAEQVALHLQFANGAQAWIHGGRLAPMRRRLFAVYTESNCFVWDDRADPPLLVTPFRWSTRYRDAHGVAAAGPPKGGEMHSMALLDGGRRTPLQRMVTAFLDGVRRPPIQTGSIDVALDVTRVLARCEASMVAHGAAPAQVS